MFELYLKNDGSMRFYIVEIENDCKYTEKSILYPLKKMIAYNIDVPFKYSFPNVKDRFIMVPYTTGELLSQEEIWKFSDNLNEIARFLINIIFR